MTTEEIIALYNDFSISTMEVCRRAGITKSSLSWIQKKHGLEKRPINKSNMRIADPTPEEIEQRAAECRAMRSEGEQARMDEMDRVRWTAPSYAFDGRNFTFHAISASPP